MSFEIGRSSTMYVEEVEHTLDICLTDTCSKVRSRAAPST